MYYNADTSQFFKPYEYKGYTGEAQYSVADKLYYGKILNIFDLVSYQADKMEDLEAEFQAAVDDYLETLKELNP